MLPTQNPHSDMDCDYQSFVQYLHQASMQNRVQNLSLLSHREIQFDNVAGSNQ